MTEDSGQKTDEISVSFSPTFQHISVITTPHLAKARCVPFAMTGKFLKFGKERNRKPPES